MRAPRVPGKARLGYKPKAKQPAAPKKKTSVVEISLEQTRTAPPAEKPPPPRPKEWYYMDLANAQQGPMDEAGLKRLYDMGDIHDFTFVWHEELPNWIALPDTPVLGAAGAAGQPIGTLSHAYC